MLRLGLVINPVAGIGGRVALKGSDGDEVYAQALQLGAHPMARQRCRDALQWIADYRDGFTVYTAAHDMGENLCRELDFDYRVVADNTAGDTHADDTEAAVQKLAEQGVDLLVFAGGDGTARNVFHALQQIDKAHSLPVIGIPAGCKIHSAVYTLTPRHAGELLALLLRGRALSLQEAAVMDIDEQAFRHDVVKARRFGELMVPAENRYMQNMKEGGVAQEALVLQDIAAYIVETMETDVVYLIGSGSTPRAVMEELGLPSTLLGVDVVMNGELLAKDVTEQQILQLIEGRRAKIIVTVIGGQGHVFGRGNQQFSPQVIRAVGRENIIIIATPEKLHALDAQPLRVDSGDAELDEQLCGMVPVITGYDHMNLYRIGR